MAFTPQGVPTQGLGFAIPAEVVRDSVVQFQKVAQKAEPAIVYLLWYARSSRVPHISSGSNRVVSGIHRTRRDDPAKNSAEMPARPRRFACRRRIHQRFYSFSTGGAESFFHRAGVEKCTRGIGRVNPLYLVLEQTSSYFGLLLCKTKVGI